MATMTGRPIHRVDGPLKVSGRATYAYEHWNPDADQPLYGCIVGATIGKGRITRIDTSHAERSPGVCLVMTHLNAPGKVPAMTPASSNTRAPIRCSAARTFTITVSR
jgi:xanthine dehydrogenase YagR molybdenum-binding subunit